MPGPSGHSDVLRASPSQTAGPHDKPALPCKVEPASEGTATCRTPAKEGPYPNYYQGRQEGLSATRENSHPDSTSLAESSSAQLELEDACEGGVGNNPGSRTLLSQLLWARSGSASRLQEFWLRQPPPAPMTHHSCGAWVDDGVVVGADTPSSPASRTFFDLKGARDDTTECTWTDLQGVSIPSVVRQMVRDESTTTCPPTVTWNVNTIRAHSMRVLADGSARPLLQELQQQRGRFRMQPDLIESALSVYPDQARLLNLALGMIIPKTPGFVPEPQRHFSKAYGKDGKAPIVHAKIQKDHEQGHVVVVNQSAAAAIRRADGNNDCPMGHVTKRDEPPPRLGRVTTNASAGRRGAFPGSLNAHTDQKMVRAMYGNADVTDVGTVARMCHDLDKRGVAVAVATADAKSAFNRLSQTVEATLDTTSRMHFDPEEIAPRPPHRAEARAETKEPTAAGMALSLVVMFGGTAAPAAWHVAQRAICWIADTQPLDWWHGGFETWKALPPRRHGPEAPIGELLQSMLAAMAFVLSPRDPDLTPLNIKKIVGPGRRRLYAGWVIDCIDKTIRLSRRGLRKLAYALHWSFRHGAISFDFAEARSAVHVLLHYASLRPAAGAFLGEMWHLIKVHSRRQSPIPSTPMLGEDLAWWRAALDVIWNSDTAAFAVSWEDAAEKGEPCVRPETDASGYGGGLYVPAYSSETGTHRPAAAWRLEWTPAEREAARTQGNQCHINIFEYAMYVLTLLTLGPEVKSFVAQVDNTSAVAWARKDRAKAPAAHDLARLAALAEFAFSTSSKGSADYLEGDKQVHADPLSRWNEPERRQAYRSLQPACPEPTLVSLRRRDRHGRARRLIQGAITGTLRAQPGWLGRLAFQLRSGW